MKKVCSPVLCLLLILAAVLPAASAANITYTITNPYAGVNWKTVGQYKTALHTHTNASDGDHTLKESIERHAQTGFDIVAVTDHGIVDPGFVSGPTRPFVKRALDLLHRSEGEITYLGTEGTFPGGAAYSVYSENGGEYLKTGGRTMLHLPFGIEQNAVSVNAHVTSWFADFHDNTVSGYEDAIRGVEKAGGLCVINHPGEYTKARYELHSADAYNEQNPSFAYHINKFASYLEQYPACIGIDMNSKGDNRTRFDRILWDKLLQRFAAKGKNVFGIASSDAHQLDVIDTGFSVLLMESQTAADAKAALQNGRFFAASHCLGNPDELYEIAEALKTLYGKTGPVFEAVLSAADAMTQRVQEIESGKLDADEDIGVTYSVLDKDGYTTVPSFPSVSAIAVDAAAQTITIQSNHALLVRMISNGKTVAAKRADSAVFDLDDYAGKLGDYVRFEVFGEGGMLYTQPFLLNAECNAAKNAKQPVTKGVFFDFGTFDFLIAEVHKWLRIAGVWLGSRF